MGYFSKGIPHPVLHGLPPVSPKLEHVDKSLQMLVYPILGFFYTPLGGWGILSHMGCSLLLIILPTANAHIATLFCLLNDYLT